MPCGSQEEHSLTTSSWEVQSLQYSLLACESCLKLRCGQNESTRALLDNRERGGVLVFCTLLTRHIDTDCSALLKTANKSSHTHPLTLQLHITWHCVERVSKLGVPHVFSCFRVFLSFLRFRHVSLFRVFVLRHVLLVYFTFFCFHVSIALFFCLRSPLRRFFCPRD